MKEVIKYMRLPFEFDMPVMQAELSALGHQWIAHFNTRFYDGEWSALPLRSPGGSITNILAHESQEFSDTEIMALCPYMKSIVDMLPGNKRAVRLLKLKAGSEIKEHRDNGLCYEGGETRIHIPIVTNKDVHCYLDKEAMTLAEGECWYLNFDLPHSFTNEGATDRVHLVIDAGADEGMKELFDRCIPAHVKKIPAKPGFSAQEKQSMIASLKQMDTPAAKDILARMLAEMEM